MSIVQACYIKEEGDRLEQRETADEDDDGNVGEYLEEIGDGEQYLKMEGDSEGVYLEEEGNGVDTEGYLEEDGNGGDCMVVDLQENEFGDIIIVPKEGQEFTGGEIISPANMNGDVTYSHYGQPDSPAYANDEDEPEAIEIVYLPEYVDYADNVAIGENVAMAGVAKAAPCERYRVVGYEAGRAASGRTNLATGACRDVARSKRVTRAMVISGSEIQSNNEIPLDPFRSPKKTAKPKSQYRRECYERKKQKKMALAARVQPSKSGDKSYLGSTSVVPSVSKRKKSAKAKAEYQRKYQERKKLKKMAVAEHMSQIYAKSYAQLQDAHTECVKKNVTLALQLIEQSRSHDKLTASSTGVAPSAENQREYHEMNFDQRELRPLLQYQREYRDRLERWKTLASIHMEDSRSQTSDKLAASTARSDLNAYVEQMFVEPNVKFQEECRERRERWDTGQVAESINHDPIASSGSCASATPQMFMESHFHFQEEYRDRVKRINKLTSELIKNSRNHNQLSPCFSSGSRAYLPLVFTKSNTQSRREYKVKNVLASDLQAPGSDVLPSKCVPSLDHQSCVNEETSPLQIHVQSSDLQPPRSQIPPSTSAPSLDPEPPLKNKTEPLRINIRNDLFPPIR